MTDGQAWKGCDRGFFETPKVSIIGIFILLKYENELDLVTNDISFYLLSP